MNKGTDKLSDRTAGIVAVVFGIIGIIIGCIGLYALIQAWIWQFPLIILMLITIPLLFAAIGICAFYVVGGLAVFIKSLSETK